MKKTFLLLAMSLLVLTSSCKKKSNDENETKPVPVEVKNYDQNNSLTSTDVYEYDVRNILKKTNTDSGGIVTVSDYYYHDVDKGLLDSIVVKKQGQFESMILYTISNNKIQKMETFDRNRNVVTTTEVLTYNGDVPARYRVFATTLYGALNLQVDVTYTGNNPTSAHMVGTFGSVPITIDNTTTYDNKNYSFLNVNTQDQTFFLQNNVLTQVNTTVFGGQTESKSGSNSITYNSDDYPTRIELTIDGNLDSVQEFLYEDK